MQKGVLVRFKSNFQLESKAYIVGLIMFCWVIGTAFIVAGFFTMIGLLNIIKLLLAL